MSDIRSNGPPRGIYSPLSARQTDGQRRTAGSGAPQGPAAAPGDIRAEDIKKEPADALQRALELQEEGRQLLQAIQTESAPAAPAPGQGAAQPPQGETLTLGQLLAQHTAALAAAAQAAAAQPADSLQTPAAGALPTRSLFAAEAAGEVKNALSEKEQELQSLLEMMQEAQKRAQEQREKFKIPKNGSRYGLTAVEAYARLFRARSHADVSAASGYAQRQISQLNAALRQDGDNAQQIRAAIRQLKSAVARAGRKKRELDKERWTEARRTRAQRNHQLAKARRIRRELAQSRVKRALRESGYLQAAHTDHLQQSQMAAAREEARLQAQQLPGASAPVDVAAMAAPAPAAAAPAVPLAAGAEAPMPE